MAAWRAAPSQLSHTRAREQIPPGKREQYEAILDKKTTPSGYQYFPEATHGWCALRPVFCALCPLHGLCMAWQAGQLGDVP